MSLLRKWSPVLLIACPWPVMLLFYSKGPILYRDLSASTLLYLGAVFVAVVLGYQLGWTTSSLPANALRQERSLSDKTFRVLVLIGTVGSVIWLIDALRSGYSFNLLLNDPIQGRILQSQHVTTMLTTLSFPFAVLSYSVFFFAIMRWGNHKRDSWTVVGMLSVVPVMLVNMLQAGRQTFFILGILLISWALLYYGNRSFRGSLALIVRRLPLLVPVILVVLGYFVFIAANRHLAGSVSLDLWLDLGGLSTRSTYQWENTLSPGVVVGAFSGIYYYTHQLSALDAIIISHVPAAGWGRGILEWTLLQLGRTGIDLTFEDLTLKTALLAHGENLWGWQTGLGTLISDFGALGSLVFVFLASIVVARFVRSAILYRSQVDILAGAWLLAACLLMIQFFPRDGIFTINVLLLLYLRWQLQHATVQGAPARLRPSIPRVSRRVPRV